MPLFNAGAQALFLARGQGIEDRSGIQQDPVLPMTVAVDCISSAAPTSSINDIAISVTTSTLRIR
jgi:hypothetical protein